MLKVYSKKAFSLMLASSLALGMSSGIMAKAAPPAHSNPVAVEDGRNGNGIGTAQVHAEYGDIYYGQPTEIRGEVVIDGARDDLANLSITINGQRVDEMWKIPDTEKTYGFKSQVTFTTHGQTDMFIKAETLFHNGQKEGKVHSNNGDIGQSIPVEVLVVVDCYDIDYMTPNNEPNFVWNPDTGTYSLTVTLLRDLSNGQTVSEILPTFTGLEPGSTLTYTSTDVGDTNYFGPEKLLMNLKVPDAPPPVDPETPAITLEWLNVDWDSIVPTRQGNQQYKVVIPYTVKYSNGLTLSLEYTVPGTLTNPTSESQNSDYKYVTLGTNSDLGIAGKIYKISIYYDEVTEAVKVRGEEVTP